MSEQEHPFLQTIHKLGFTALLKEQGKRNLERNEIHNRIWVDKIPTSDKEFMNLFVTITEEEIGVFQQQSQFHGDFDLFTFDQANNNFVVTMLQTDKTYKVSCKVNLKEENGFDMSLEINGAPRGPKKYYSRKKWIIESLSDKEALLDEITSLRAENIVLKIENTVMEDKLKS